ncbi:MAG: arsenite methyltransferase [Bacteroidales bacterium]|nr:MAG: arsenite methyltransferase [Bacteroidales bacterium]
MKKSNNEIRDAVRKSYRKVAENALSDNYCGCSPGEDTGCCSPEETNLYEASSRIGYSDKELKEVPEGSNLGLGCGNPQAIAALKEGETVLDLGSGAGFDVFLAARQVGDKGKVIGVDMTQEMISKARKNAAMGNFNNVEFRLGEIENIPVADNTADVIISNCVINLSPEKQKVFNESLRVLKPGGRLAITDNITTAELPEEIKNNLEHYSACISGAALVGELENMLKNAGFINIKIEPIDKSRKLTSKWIPGGNINDYIVPVTVEAAKPEGIR